MGTKSIYETGRGWIAPSGEMIGCNFYGHLEVLSKWEPARKAFLEFDEELEHLEGVKESCEELIREGEHPEWHCYQIAENGLETDVAKALLKAGFVRVLGASIMHNDIEVECSSETYLQMIPFLDRLEKEYNATNNQNCRIRFIEAKWIRRFK